MTETINIRPATEADTPLILRFIRALAEYERLADQVSADGETLRRSLFGPDRSAECLLAYNGAA